MARPREEKSIALLSALKALDEEGKHPTMRELAYRSLVAVRDARTTMINLVRAGQVEIKAYRRVHYRNRPVAEYSLPSTKSDSGVAALGQVLGAWKAGERTSE